jgi:fatty acid desaturase
VKGNPAPKTNHSEAYLHILHTYLTEEEINRLLQKSDVRGALEVIQNWLWILAAFLMAGLWPHPLTLIPALFIIGGKQLGCAIIMHDASHHSLFKSRKANDFVGSWLGAYPIFHSVKRYRPYHMEHHIFTGNAGDPDLPLTDGYPATRKSMARKFLRDLFGITGIKGFFGLIMIQCGFWEYRLSGVIVPERNKNSHWITAIHNMSGPVVFNLALWCILCLAGAGWLYLLWIGALLTTYTFSLRVRSMAEHSMSPDPSDPKKNTRTVYAHFLEKLLFAPLHVNYHTEHHLFMAAPSYRYPEMHKLLKQRGFYEEGLLLPGYLAVIRNATMKSG